MLALIPEPLSRMNTGDSGDTGLSAVYGMSLLLSLRVRGALGQLWRRVEANIASGTMLRRDCERRTESGTLAAALACASCRFNRRM